MNYSCKLLFYLFLFSIFSCQQEEQEEKQPRPAIDPSKIKIDVEAGAIHTPDGVLIMYKKAGSGSETIVVPNLTYINNGLRALEEDYSLIYYDARNRGRSQTVMNGIQLKGGINNDVKDLETLRQHFKLDRLNIIGHGHYGLVAALYGVQYPDKLGKVVMLNPSPAPVDQDPGAPYTDKTTEDIEKGLSGLAEAKSNMKDLEYCERWWGIAKNRYIGDEFKSRAVDAQICKYPNEMPDRQMAYQQKYVNPSLEKLKEDGPNFRKLQSPVLIIWGEKDRLYGAKTGTIWKSLLPDASLTRLKDAGNMSWIEAPNEVTSAIKTFFK